jgi:hypothetical protein
MHVVVYAVGIGNWMGWYGMVCISADEVGSIGPRGMQKMVRVSKQEEHRERTACIEMNMHTR